jgi:hypothetical protein
VLLTRALPILFVSAALAQNLRPNLPPVPVYQVHRATSPVEIDGTLDEAAWKRAAPVPFQFPWDKQTGVKQQTTAQMLWDDKYLYIAWVADDTDIVAHYGSPDDPTYLDDAVELFINPDPSQSYYYGLEINARATIYDYLYVYPKLLVKRVNFEGVKIASYLRGTMNVRGDTDKGWVIELAIPWRNFTELTSKLPPAPGAAWTANLNRWDGVEPDRRLSQWSDSGRPEPSPHNPERFGRLLFVE